MTTATSIDAALIDREFPKHPYPVYRLLQQEAPVHWHGGLGYWFVSKYDDAKCVLMNWSDFSSGGWDQIYIRQLPDWRPGSLEHLERHFAFPSLISADPPLHTRLRRLVNRVFTPAAVETLRAHIEGLVDRQLRTLVPGATFDVVHDLAVPLPISLFAFMFGLPESEHTPLKRTSSNFTSFVSNVAPDWDQAQLANESLGQFRTMLLEIIQSRRTSPRDDLASILVTPNADGEQLSDDELLSLCAHLLVAGHETTTNLIANGALALLTHPTAREQLQCDAGLWPRAIEEVLRWETPLQRVKRMATRDITLGGRSISAGDRVMILVGAANRDPDVFNHADMFDVAVERKQHLGFGGGIHFCVGAPLARLEGRIALEGLLVRAPRLRLASNSAPNWNASLLRGLDRLLVAC